MIRKRLFGTSGIRGVTNREITPELCLKIAQAFGTWVRRTGKSRGKIGVAHDTRYGAPVLANAVAAGIAASGHDVVHGGVLPSGPFALNVRLMHADGGVMITGSHMPYDRIGIMLVLPDGSSAPFDVTDVVEDIYHHGPLFHVKPDEMGSISQATNPFDLYTTELLTRVDRKHLASKNFRVLVDPANGAASVIGREIFEKLGCEVVSVNSSYQPVPNRPSEPRADTVEEAKNIAKVLKLDLGICFDVDADRALFVDKTGASISEDAAGAIFAHAELKPDDVCVVPVNSSGLIEWLCRRVGAKLEYSKIGQPEIVKSLKDLRGVFGYEESGKYYFARTYPWSDGIYSAVRMLEIMAHERKTIHELADALPKFYQGKHGVRVDDVHKDKIMEEVFRRMKLMPWADTKRDVVIDGFKRIFADDSWVMIRASGTEPLIRIYSDATTPERAGFLVEEAKTLLNGCLQAVTGSQAQKPITSLFPRVSSEE